MKTTLLKALLLATVLILPGCTADPAGEPGDTPPSGEADPFTKVVTYVECLQEQGLPVKLNPGDGYTMPKDTDPAAIEAAEAACRGVAPPGMYARPSAEELDRYVKVARCLRGQGIQVADPTLEDPQLRIEHPPQNLRELQEACEESTG
ncbi:hypothetical protein Ait01nite_013650 [Actinoplanes italicus]|uniref:Secreted protein n=1 Tax=Actinoplanes italicus TaxID=113567 RepID=A0A2T0KH99_9ACTN|nr:hypothetical protein [Actinoplanes italicus]PRX22798.1 hypothetical protein CLV67_104326 [Actinoplanes italicus]GIE28320.1 hypothetical protein Ait01nite_013650 [Actinoplanes italicus]